MASTALLIAAIVTGPALLLGWSLLYSLDCMALLIPAFVIITLTLGARSHISRRRQCSADCYFQAGSLLHRLMRSTTLATLWAAVIASALTTVLMVSIPSWDTTILALLAADALLITLLYVGFARLASGPLHVHPGYRLLFAKRWAVAVNIPLIVAALFYYQLQQPPPAYIDAQLDLHNSLQAASAQTGSACPITDRLVRLNQEKDAFSWWLMLKGNSDIDSLRVRQLAWLLFLLSGTLSLWAYSRLCVQLVYSAHRRNANDEG